jgi:hypothetical protein
MHDNDMCHIWRSNGSRPLAATYRTLGGYGPVQMSE